MDIGAEENKKPKGEIVDFYKEVEAKGVKINPPDTEYQDLMEFAKKAKEEPGEDYTRRVKTGFEDVSKNRRGKHFADPESKPKKKREIKRSKKKAKKVYKDRFGKLKPIIKKYKKQIRNVGIGLGVAAAVTAAAIGYNYTTQSNIEKRNSDILSYQAIYQDEERDDSKNGQNYIRFKASQRAMDEYFEVVDGNPTKDEQQRFSNNYNSIMNNKDFLIKNSLDTLKRKIAMAYGVSADAAVTYMHISNQADFDSQSTGYQIELNDMRDNRVIFIGGGGKTKMPNKIEEWLTRREPIAQRLKSSEDGEKEEIEDLDAIATMTDELEGLDFKVDKEGNLIVTEKENKQEKTQSDERD